jgi:peptidoglycan hydrolase-like protein with peptidoglycan-binding domain
MNPNQALDRVEVESSDMQRLQRPAAQSAEDLDGGVESEASATEETPFASVTGALPAQPLAVDVIIDEPSFDPLDPSNGEVQRHNTVRMGSTGLEVSLAQGNLMRAGFDKNMVVDGIFGPITRANTVAFQQANGLDPDGIIGPKTWDVLDPPEGLQPNPPINSNGEPVFE